MPENLKIKYVMNLRLPTERAHGIQIMKTCEAFANLGHDVELIVPSRGSSIKENPFDYYKIENNFRIRRLSLFGIPNFDRFGFAATILFFSVAILYNVPSRGSIFYTRDKSLGFLLKMAGRKVVWEDHMGHANLLARALVSLRTPTVVITESLKSVFLRLGAPSTRVWVAPDAVDVSQFDIPETREQSRHKLGLESDEKLVVYTGHLYEWKGAGILAQAASKIKSSAKIIFVGGTEKDVVSFSNKYGDAESICILGKKPHGDMPLYMRSADILVIPNSGKENISRLYTSPMKLFEYMASGTPIISSDLPSLREILTKDEAYFFTPDDPRALAGAIDYALGHPRETLSKAERAFEKVKQYSWEKRAQGIINFIRST